VVYRFLKKVTPAIVCALARLAGISVAIGRLSRSWNLFGDFRM
jgi:hypothetical protein